MREYHHPIDEIGKKAVINKLIMHVFYFIRIYGKYFLHIN